MKYLKFSLAILIAVSVLSCSKKSTISDNMDTAKYSISTNIPLPNSGKIILIPDKDKYSVGEYVDIIAVPNKYFRFKNWAGYTDSPKDTITIKIHKDVVISAVFEEMEIPEYNFSISQSGEGAVIISPESPNSKYQEGTVLTLTAVPNPAWDFKKWEGDAESTDNIIEVTITKNLSIIAVFQAQEGVEPPKFYLDANGVTVKCPLADVGESGEVNGITYTKRTVQEITPDNASTSCTSGITSLYTKFKDNATFNEDISSWDVSAVTNMVQTFFNASSFNADISKWDVSNVTEMNHLFNHATSFNADISKWDVRSTVVMNNMFNMASSFNRDLSGWNVSNVTAMISTFQDAILFNADLSGWNVSNVITHNNFNLRSGLLPEHLPSFP